MASEFINGKMEVSFQENFETMPLMVQVGYSYQMEINTPDNSKMVNLVGVVHYAIIQVQNIWVNLRRVKLKDQSYSDGYHDDRHQAPGAVPEQSFYIKS